MASVPLDQRPIHTSYVKSYHKIKTADGLAIDAAYLKKYYSVIDAEIYFGNEFVEDIAFIDWTVTQNVMPLFGYNSYTYDEVARGNRIISGVFDINFTSPNYLYDILEAANNVNTITNMKSYTVNVPYETSAEIDSDLTGSKINGGNGGPIYDQTFDIDIIFGQKDYKSDPVHILLEGVVIQSCSSSLSASASASPPSIMERYQFIARDVKTVV